MNEESFFNLVLTCRGGDLFSQGPLGAEKRTRD